MDHLHHLLVKRNIVSIHNVSTVMAHTRDSESVEMELSEGMVVRARLLRRVTHPLSK